MKKVQSNKYDVAMNAVSKMQGVKIPAEILESESKLYHVALIESKSNLRTFEFTHTVMIKKFNFESFSKSQDTYARLGYGKMIIFHDPTLPIKDIETTTTTTDVADKITVKDLEKEISNYSIEELELMLETETRVGAIKLIQERLEFLTNEEA